MSTNAQSEEPIAIQSQDPSTSLLVEQNELLDTEFSKALESIDSLIALYSIQPDDEGAREQCSDLLKTLRHNQLPLAQGSAKLLDLERRFHDAYMDKLKELSLLEESSYSHVSKNNKIFFEQRMKSLQVLELEKSLGKISNIELASGERLDVSLSKERVMELLEAERKERAIVSFKNEDLLKPEIKDLRRDYDTWGKRDNELKRYLVDDLEAMDKKVKAIVTKEKWAD